MHKFSLNSMSPIVELIANSASVMVIFSEPEMSNVRKTLLFALIGIVVLCSITKLITYLIPFQTAHRTQEYAYHIANNPFVIRGVTRIKVSGDIVFMCSTPNHSGNRLDTFHKGTMVKYDHSVLDKEGRTWHRGTCNGSTGWMCSTCTVLQ